MRGELRGAWGALIVASALGACSSSPPPTTRVFPDPDTGVFPFEDAGIPPDAFAWPDTGPPLPPVLPAQSWIVDVDVNGRTLSVTFDVDARAEAGIVRVVAGASGRATAAVFDATPDGRLTARTPIPMGIPGEHTCSPDTLSVVQWTLIFADTDADGVHERLADATTNGYVTESGPMGVNTYSTGIFVLSVRADDTAPTLTLANEAPIVGYEPVVLEASEPIAPSFMPRLVGPTTVWLTPDVGSTSPARWRAETHGLPIGHYDLALDGVAQDLSGHAATTLPTLSFDVPALGLPAVDDFGAEIVGVLAAGPVEVLGDDAGEAALVGTTSLHTVGRTIVVFDAPAGSHNLWALTRFEGSSLASVVSPAATVFDSRGAVVGQGTSYAYFSDPSQVPGFDVQTVPSGFSIPFRGARAGRFYAVIDPGGTVDLACTAGSATVPDVGMTLDQLTLM